MLKVHSEKQQPLPVNYWTRFPEYFDTTKHRIGNLSNQIHNVTINASILKCKQMSSCKIIKINSKQRLKINSILLYYSKDRNTNQCVQKSTAEHTLQENNVHEINLCIQARELDDPNTQKRSFNETTAVVNE